VDVADIGAWREHIAGAFRWEIPLQGVGPLPLREHSDCEKGDGLATSVDETDAGGGSLRARRWYVAADRDVGGRGILVGVGVLVHRVLGVDVSVPLPASFSNSSPGRRRLAIVHHDFVVGIRWIRVGCPWDLLSSLLPLRGHPFQALAGGIAAALEQHGAVFC
jgi:hypothetical protein